MRRYLETLPAALLLSVHFVIAASLENLYGNRMEFEFGSSSVLPTIVAIALAVAVVLCLLGAALPAAGRSRYIALVFALGCLGWLQSSFLHGDYGELTGEAIDWSNSPLGGWLELVLWLGLIAAAFLFHRRLRAHIRFLAPALAILELLGLGGRAMLNPADAPPPAEVAAASLSRFSREQNVIHILMDAFQSDVFLELVQEEGLADDFDGFTVFPENASVAPFTAMSLPAIFSGDIYDGTETPSEYHHRALRQGGFHRRLFEEGYAVHLIPKIPMYGDGYTLYAETPHLYGVARSLRVRHQTALLLDLGLFRSSPHLLRRLIHDDGNWLLQKSLGSSVQGLNTHQRTFFADYIDQMEVVLDEPAYHFIHLMPPHDPFTTLPDGSDAGHTLPRTRENYKIEAHYSLQLFVALLERLREFQLYDSALIVLHADHGFGPLVQNPGDTRTLRVPRAAALLAVKRIGRHGPLEISEAPTSVADIPATILDGLGFEHEMGGHSVFDLSAEQPRTRFFNAYSLSAKSRGIIQRYELNGSIYDPSAWRPMSNLDVDLGAPMYDWGTTVEFGLGNDSDRFLLPGWTSGASGGRLNLYSTGAISLQTAATPSELRAVFEFRPRLREGEQRRFGIRLFSNGKLVGQHIMEPQPERIEFLIPAGHARSGLIDLKFEFVVAGSDNQDTALALCLLSMSLEPKNKQ
jgi:Sulfatase